MSLKDRLAAHATSPTRAIEMDAPELGEGEVAHVVRFTIGARLAFSQEFDRLQEKTADGKRFLTPVDEQLRHLITRVACEPDGSMSFTGSADPAVLLMPATLAQRMIDEAVTRSSESGAAAKKPSPGTPS